VDKPEIIRKLRSLQPVSGSRLDRAVAFLHRNYLLGKLSRHTEIIRRSGAAIRNDIWFWPALMDLGVAHLELRQLPLALDAFERVLLRDPEITEAMVFCGMVMRRQNRFDEAEEILNRCLALRPDEKFAHGQLCIVQFKKRRYNEALASVDRAIELDPDLAVFWAWRSRVLLRLDRLAEAEAASARILALDPAF
jgi:tetratricopeptide (TPR) repeat protein